jgi:hypothetical protein
MLVLEGTVEGEAKLQMTTLVLKPALRCASETDSNLAAVSFPKWITISLQSATDA